MPPVAIVLGSARTAHAELAAALALAPDAPVIAVNDAFKTSPVKPIAFATLHPEKHRRFLEGADLEGVRIFAHEMTRRAAVSFEIVREKWGGTSGLFAVQVALDVFGFAGVILAGCP